MMEDATPKADTAVIAALKKARAAVATQSDKFSSSPVFHFDKMHYFIGVLIAYVVVYFLGCCPGDFWKLHVIQFAGLVPIQIYRWACLGNLAYFVEFCWLANLTITVYLSFAWFDPAGLDDYWRAVFFRMLFALGAGPLSGAMVLLHNALVPHHIDMRMSLLIHLQPMLTAFSLRWDNHNEELFPTDEPTNFLEYIIPPLCFLAMYAVLHSIFFISIGLKLPEKGYSTTPDFNLNPKRANFFVDLLGPKHENGSGEACRFLQYEAISCTANALCIVGSYPLYVYGSKTIHGFYVVALCMISAFNGAEWYAFQIKRFPGVVDDLIKKEEGQANYGAADVSPTTAAIKS